jgi:deoxycytidine triphosphate deaminase
VNEPRPTSVLSDGTIRRLIEEGRVTVEPWDPDMVQPASVDLRLGDSFRVFHNHLAPAIDLDSPPAHLTELITVPPDKSFVIHPGEFVLGRTLEQVSLPDDVVARIEGKALDVETPVPTTDGWKMMSDIEVGDHVFDPDGRPVPVIATTEPMLDRECRDVVFSDGTVITADVDHGWEVFGEADGVRRVVRTLDLETVRRGVVTAAVAPIPVKTQALVGIGAPSAAAREPVSDAEVGPRAIVDVAPTDSVPVRCIEVGSARGTFLVSRAYIPTHNSSLGRLGLIVHATAGFVDPGFAGTLTLEITNLTRIPIILWPGKPIAQLSFMALDRPAERPYGHPDLGSHYHGQVEATESRYEGGPAR